LNKGRYRDLRNVLRLAFILSVIVTVVIVTKLVLPMSGYGDKTSHQIIESILDCFDARNDPINTIVQQYDINDEVLSICIKSGATDVFESFEVPLQLASYLSNKVFHKTEIERINLYWASNQSTSNKDIYFFIQLDREVAHDILVIDKSRYETDAEIVEMLEQFLKISSSYWIAKSEWEALGKRKTAEEFVQRNPRYKSVSLDNGLENIEFFDE